MATATPGLSAAQAKGVQRDASQQLLGLAAAQGSHTAAREAASPFEWYRPADWDRFTPPPGYLDEFWGSYKHALGQQNFEMLGSALEATGYMMDSPGTAQYGTDMREWAAGLGVGTPPSVQSLADIDGVDSAMRFIMGGLGSGLGSTTPSLIGGSVGAVAGSMVAPGVGTVVGGVAGATLPAMPLNLGEAYDQFVREGVDKPTAAQAAGWLTPALTALDMAGLFGAVGAASKPLKGAFMARVAKRVALGIAGGALAEGTTEGLQSTLREAVAAQLTDNPDIGERAMRILDETVIGALTGGVIGGAAGIARSAREPQERVPDEEADIDDLAEAQPGGPLSVRTIYGGAEGQPGAAVPGRAQPRGPSPSALPRLPLEGEVLPPERGGPIAEAEQAPGLEVDPLEGVVLKNDLTPYRTHRSAMMAARGRGLRDHKPVKVGGGWGLRYLPAPEQEIGKAEPRGPSKKARKTAEPLPTLTIRAKAKPAVPEAKPVAPETAPRVEPEAAVAVEPETAAPVLPAEARPVAPERVRRLKPKKARMVEPETAAPVAPVAARAVPPEEAPPVPPGEEVTARTVPPKADLADVDPPAARRLLKRAEKEVDTAPTEAQKKAGVY